MKWSSEARRGALAALLAVALLVDLGLAGAVGLKAWREVKGARDLSERPQVQMRLAEANTKAPGAKPVRGHALEKVYLAGGYRWLVTKAQWQAGEGVLALNLSISASSALATGRSADGLGPVQARALCRAVLMDLPPGAPEGSGRGDIDRIAFRLFRGGPLQSGGAGRPGGPWSGWLVYYVVDGQCTGTTRAALQEVLMSRAVERNIVARRGVWIIERESWVREGGALQFRLWIRSSRRIARDVAMEMTPLTLWTLCSVVLAQLPEQRPEGVGRGDISIVAFHRPGETGGWITQPVENGICRFPEGARD